jgi:hypothetical protein
MTLADGFILLAAGTAAGIASTVFSLASLVSYLERLPVIRRLECVI